MLGSYHGIHGLLGQLKVYQEGVAIGPNFSCRKVYFSPPSSSFVFPHLFTHFALDPGSTLPLTTFAQSSSPSITSPHHHYHTSSCKSPVHATPLNHHCAITHIHPCVLLYYNGIAFSHGYLPTWYCVFVGLSGGEKYIYNENTTLLINIQWNCAFIVIFLLAPPIYNEIILPFWIFFWNPLIQQKYDSAIQCGKGYFWKLKMLVGQITMRLGPIVIPLLRLVVEVEGK